MSVNAEDVSRQSPTPSNGNPEGSSLRDVANQISGLLDDDGHFNPNPEQLSRSHPDYDPDTDPRNQSPDRDERGRFKSRGEADDDGDDTDITDAIDTDEDDDTRGDDRTEDTDQDTDRDTDDDQTASAEDDAGANDQETDGDDIQTLTQLADALEVPIDELKESITHTFTAADEETTVTLAELEAGYQKDADYRRNTRKLAEDRRAAETDYAGRMQAYEQQNVFLANNFTVTEQLLAAELESPRLNALRESDPAEWNARRTEIGDRIGQLRQARMQAAQNFENFSNQQKLEMKGREQQALLAAIPDFSAQHRDLAKNTMVSLGYAEAETLQLFDHRQIVALLELATLRSEVETLRAEKTKAKDTVKRVKTDVPKLQKPGKKQTKGRGRIKRDNVSRLKNRARKSGSVDDAAKVIEQMI